MESALEGSRARLIQVGLGTWGRNWATDIVPRVAKADVVAWVDANPEVLAKARTELDLPNNRCFLSLSDAFNAVQCEGVLGTVALVSHELVVREAISARKPVLIEKPFLATSAEASTLAEDARRAGVIVHVNQNYRFFPAPTTAARLVAEKRLGRPLNVEVAFDRYAPGEGYRYFNLPHPLLIDMSIHHLDLMRMVLAVEPEWVSCTTWNPPGSPFSHAPCGSGVIGMQDGTVVRYSGSWLSRRQPTPYAGLWTIECEGGRIEFTCRGDRDLTTNADRVTIAETGGISREVDLDPMPLFGRAGALDAFCRASLGEEHSPNASTAESNVMSLRLMEGMVDSAERLGARIDLPPMRSKYMAEAVR